MTMAQQDLFIDSKVEEITPQQAALWLEGANKRNRPLNHARAQALASAIQRGEWWLNGDAIRFCTSGQLLDGQHRLQAIVYAGQAVRTLVVRGLHPDSFTTIDTNRKSRNLSDTIALAGIANYTQLSSVARYMHSWETYGIPFEAKGEKLASVDQLMPYAQRRDLQDATRTVANAKWCKKYIGVGLMGFCYAAFKSYRPEHADAFLAKLESGSGLEEGSPVLALRNRLMMDKTGHTRVLATVKGAMVFKAWRLYLLGANVQSFKNPVVKGVHLRELFKMERSGEGR